MAIRRTSLEHLEPGIVNVNQPWIDASSEAVGGGFSVRTSQRVATSARTGGKTFKNIKWDIEAEDLIVDTRAGPVNAEFTGMLQAILNKQFGEIQKPVAPATAVRRERAARQDQNSASYKRRYAGGRIGHLPPNTQAPPGTWLKDSGRLQHTSINLRNRNALGGATGNVHTQGAATINLPANRLDPAHPDWRGAGGQAQLQVVINEMQTLLPILGKWDAKTQDLVNQGIDAMLEGLISNSQARFQALLRRRNMALRQLLRGFGINADWLTFTQQLRMQRGVRVGKQVEKQTVG